MTNHFYYSKDNVTFTNRIQALNYNYETGKNIYLYYYDHIYDKLNWKIEPIESLDFHYRQQAQRIRDEYDYVILCYSGGYDSTHILETFYYNNIKLDKIVITGPFSQDSHFGSDENHNREIYLNAFPHINELSLSNIVQLIDYSTMYGNIKQFSVYELGENWVEEIGCKFSPHHFFWRDLDKFVVPNKYKDKKVAIVWGTDKTYFPENMKIKGFKFRDGPLTSYSRFHQPKNNNIENINFYWDPNYPLIILKQLHTIKNYRPLMPLQYAKLIYNLKKIPIYKSSKSQSPVISKRDYFLINKKNDELFDFYHMGVRKISHLINSKNIRSIQSKFYAIE
jgi:hypothetical protein